MVLLTIFMSIGCLIRHIVAPTTCKISVQKCLSNRWYDSRVLWLVTVIIGFSRNEAIA